ncbi:AAA family ATPase [Candidatus Berkelbacteria bacterium]|nr:AAA family ATPase [Candidatus Berkelbacteria bacterium]
MMTNNNKKKFFVVIDGPMGAGKTTVAKLLHQKFKRTALLGIDRVKWAVSDFTRSSEDNAMTADVVLAMGREYLKHGLNIILDQGFMRKEFLHPYIQLAKKEKAHLLIYQLEAPRDILLGRITSRPKPDSAKRKVSKTKTLKNIRTYFENKYAKAQIIDSSTLTPKQIVDMISKDIALL